MHGLPGVCRPPEKYPFEKIAGKGTDLQRAIRVLKYLSPKLTHSPWYDGHVDCNALALLDYSLDKPEQGINCLNKAKILEEVCLALGIYARRVRFLPYSPFDFDCHVVTEIYDRSQEKWCMLDPTTNGYLVDEQGTILSLLEARERMADTRFVTYCKATSREKDLQKLYRKISKEPFTMQRICSAFRWTRSRSLERVETG